MHGLFFKKKKINFLDLEGGFTLVEMLGVVFIMGFLMFMSVPQLQRANMKAKAGLESQNMKMVEGAKRAFEAENPGVLLVSEAQLAKYFPDGRWPESPWGLSYFNYEGALDLGKTVKSPFNNQEGYEPPVYPLESNGFNDLGSPGYVVVATTEFPADYPLPSQTTTQVVPSNLLQVKAGFLNGVWVAEVEMTKTETTWKEWQEVRDWAVLNGYMDLFGVGDALGPNHPVGNVSWYDVLKWLNAKSEMEGLQPVYYLDSISEGMVYRTGKPPEVWEGDTLVSTSRILKGDSSGYRLPTNAEWDWAASGGVDSRGYRFSGSSDLEEVAWHAYSGGLLGGGGVREVGGKKANELGFYDMHGNLSEYVGDPVLGSGLIQMRGGSVWDAPWSYDQGYATSQMRGPEWYGAVGFRAVRTVPKAPAESPKE